MKNKIFLVALIACMVGLVQSCKKDGIDIYKQEAGVFIKKEKPSDKTVYTFVENLDKIDVGYDIVNIPVMITGMASDKDRVFKVEYVKSDTLNTVEEGMIEISDGIVKANMYEGLFSVKINYSTKLDDSIYVARVRIVSTTDFPVDNLNSEHHSITFGNIFTQPENWSKIASSFGKVYSNSWYKWVLKTTGRSSIPYKYYRGKDDTSITPEEAKRWPMRNEELKALSAVVKVALTKYNNDNPGNPMIHEDGEKKGERVVM